MYVVEITLKLSPLPLSVLRKELVGAESLYKDLCRKIESGQPKLIEITCDQVQGKKVAFLATDVLAVQIYEKSAASGGVRRPGFSFGS